MPVTIMSIDDDEMSLRLIQAILEKENYKVSCHTSGIEGLKYLNEVKVKPDLIMLDVNMPEIDGYQVCKMLRLDPQLSLIPVIFLTAKISREERSKAFSAGAVDFLSKPIDSATLLKTIQKHLKTKDKWAAEFKVSPNISPAPLPPRKESQHIPSHKNEKSPPIKSDALPTVNLDFEAFKKFLFERVKRSDLGGVLPLDPQNMYDFSGDLGLKPSEMARILAEYSGIPYMAVIKNSSIEMGSLPAVFCHQHKVIPLQSLQGIVAFVMEQPFDVALQNALSLYKGAPLFISEPDNIRAILKPGSTSSPQADVSSPKSQTQKLSPLIEKAFEMGASDIHIEPRFKTVDIRFRINGQLILVQELASHEEAAPLFRQLKMLALLDEEEDVLPQSGQIDFQKYSINQSAVILNVSTMAAHHGEKAVIKLQVKDPHIFPLEDLGFSESNLDLFREKLKEPRAGLILHAGPRHSGRRLAIYSALSELDHISCSIQTLESHVKYDLSKITQLYVNPLKGLSLSKVFKACLEQVPDVVFLEQVDEPEIIKQVINAFPSEYLLFSRLYAQDAVGAVLRLLDLQMTPYQLCHSVQLICAQRLLRRLCTECCEPDTPSGSIQSDLMLIQLESPVFYKSKGCEVCYHTGYKGWVGIQELLIPNDTLYQGLREPQLNYQSLRKLALQHGQLRPLYFDAIDKAAQGLTSLSEVYLNLAPEPLLN